MTLRTKLFAAAMIVAGVAACKPSSTVGSPGTTATPAPAANKAPAMPAGVTDSSIAEGKALFMAATSNCTRCHGPDGTGGTRGPNLMDSVWVHNDGSPSGIAHTIMTGVPASEMKGQYQFPMAPKGRANITDAQVNAIASYLWSASHKH